jgi:hypothetical protein
MTDPNSETCQLEQPIGKHNWTVAMVKASDVVELLGRLEARGINVWLNGGWGSMRYSVIKAASTKIST